MEPLLKKEDIVKALQKEVLSMQRGGAVALNEQSATGLGAIEEAFPGKEFPRAAVHEFISYDMGAAAATNGFMMGVAGKLMPASGVCVWVGAKRTVYPVALAQFGIAPDRVIFIDPARKKDVLWTIEEALKCEALQLVVGEVGELSFMESRRLQLAVERSSVTGFIHRKNPRTENTVACVSRWKITPATSIADDGMPGLGMPRWHVQLQKVRNGKPGSWVLEWRNGTLCYVPKTIIALPEVHTRKTG